METKRLLWFVLAMGLILLPIAAQSPETVPPETNVSTEANIPAGIPVFAPFVSLLQLELQNNLLRISWVDSPVVRGTVYIYRSTAPFERSGLRTGLRIAEIPYGEQFHIDDVEAGERDRTFYYFVIASDEMGRVFDIPIIYLNTRSILIPAAYPAFAQIPPPVLEQPAIPVIPPGISSLQATVDGSRVIITFTQNPETSDAILYRSVHPIRHRADLSSAQIVREGVRSPLTDYLIRGIPYYYAVILEDDLRRGTVEIIPGQNATIASVEIALDPAEQRRIRPMPLPMLSVHGATSALGLHAGPPPLQELSPEAAKALGDIPTRPAPEAATKRPRVFARDLAPTQALGEDFVLSAIVTGPFAERNWEAARHELIGFLALPRSAEAQARARFYLGQSYYFMHMPREGLFEFLAIQERHPAEAMAWIQASLDMLRDQP